MPLTFDTSAPAAVSLTFYFPTSAIPPSIALCPRLWSAENVSFQLTHIRVASPFHPGSFR